MNKNGSIIDSFRNAFMGIGNFFKAEKNSRIHLVISILVIVLGFLLDISSFSWVALILTITLVWALEMINTSIEKLSDFIQPERNEQIRLVKDISAGAVLISALASIFIGLLIFLPPLIAVVQNFLVYK